MEQDPFERVRAILRHLESRLPRVPARSLPANASLEHALELVRVLERDWLIQHPVDVRITYWLRRAQGEEMVAAMDRATLQRSDEGV